MQKFEEMPQTDMAQLYKMHWPLLFSIAYRLLGTRSEAEDIVQDVFVSLQAVDREQVENMKAFLSRAVTNRCLNLLKSAKKQRELYVGPWLPEPLYALDGNEPLQRLELQENISYAYLVMLDQLSPVERVSFVLREAFGYEYEEIAEIVAKSAENCRKICSRARQKMKRGQAQNASHPQQERIVQRFGDLLQTGQIAEVVALLSDQVAFISDGGGKVRAAMRPIIGIGRVSAFLAGISAKGSFSKGIRPVQVNGQSGLMVTRDGSPAAVWSFGFDETTGHVTRIYAVFNPDKLPGGVTF
ncbi:RNA polymerase sigma-70 factor [Brevibacillus fluminis]|uniref:RNA polymerase sigma-70 factor n=1 Tax=Brevibacillus fluminis TaxID=511487 RepID=UPI003F8B966F